MTEAGVEQVATQITPLYGLRVQQIWSGLAAVNGGWLFLGQTSSTVRCRYLHYGEGYVKNGERRKIRVARAQTKNRIAMNDTYHSLSSICREGREVLRPPSHHPSFYRTVHSHAKPLTPHPTFAGMNSAGFFFAMSTTCAYLAVMRGSAWPRKSRTARRPPV